MTVSDGLVSGAMAAWPPALEAKCFKANMMTPFNPCGLAMIEVLHRLDDGKVKDWDVTLVRHQAPSGEPPVVVRLHDMAGPTGVEPRTHPHRGPGGWPPGPICQTATFS